MGVGGGVGSPITSIGSASSVSTPGPVGATSAATATPDCPGNTMETGTGSSLLRTILTVSPWFTSRVGPGYCTGPCAMAVASLAA